MKQLNRLSKNMLIYFSVSPRPYTGKVHFILRHASSLIIWCHEDEKLHFLDFSRSKAKKKELLQYRFVFRHPIRAVFLRKSRIYQFGIIVKLIKIQGNIVL